MTRPFNRDFETVDEYRERMKREDQAEPLTVETDMGKVLDAPSPWAADIGVHTSRRDSEAFQAEQDRWTRWERMGR